MSVFSFSKTSSNLKNSARRHVAYSFVRDLKRAFRSAFKTARNADRRVISLLPEGPPIGRVLLSYINDVFFHTPGQSLSRLHPKYYRTKAVGDTFLELGYIVDVIDWKNDQFTPQGDEYAFFVDVRRNLERIGPLLNSNCVKIFHVDHAHILFHNAAESRRLLALQQRKGVTLRNRRFEMPNLAIEHADCGITIGNRFVIDTYRYAGKPIYRVANSVPTVLPWPDAKDFDACRNNYLWLGSSGMVHKGLDLVLDAFAAMPTYNLTICGPVSQEKDFESAYYRELYQSPNIKLAGWMDTSSPEFFSLLSNNLAIVYPSCSEAGSTCAITCMHGGLIPVLSYESAVDVNPEFGFILRENTIEGIKDSVRHLSSLPASDLARMARNAWEYARANHTPECFSRDYAKIIRELSSKPSRRA
jgi:glycosyltransferase involved in cell wall biosynthesis